MDSLLLTSTDIRTVINGVGLDQLMDELTAGLEQVLQDWAPTQFDVPVRGGFEYSTPVTGLLEWMPALRYGDSATVKMVGYHPLNPHNHHLPTILSTAYTFDVRTGHLTAVVDATLATALRTGAASAVASRVLAAPESCVLGVIGCGAQAVTQIHALCRCFPIRRILASDTNPQAVASLARRIAACGLPADLEIVSASAAEALEASDIVCTQTSVAIGAGPIVADGPHRDHLHINAVGSDFPGKTELPASLLGRSFVCPDFLAQAAREGECQQLAPAAVGPDLAALVKNSAAFSHQQMQTTVFDSTGWALEDHVVIELLVQHATRLGLGSPVALEAVPPDPADPYHGLGAAPAAASAFRAAGRSR